MDGVELSVEDIPKKINTYDDLLKYTYAKLYQSRLVSHNETDPEALSYFQKICNSSRPRTESEEQMKVMIRNLYHANPTSFNNCLNGKFPHYVLLTDTRNIVLHFGIFRSVYISWENGEYVVAINSKFREKSSFGRGRGGRDNDRDSHGGRGGGRGRGRGHSGRGDRARDKQARNLHNFAEEIDNSSAFDEMFTRTTTEIVTSPRTEDKVPALEKMLDEIREELRKITLTQKNNSPVEQIDVDSLFSKTESQEKWGDLDETNKQS